MSLGAYNINAALSLPSLNLPLHFPKSGHIREIPLVLRYTLYGTTSIHQRALNDQCAGWDIHMVMNWCGVDSVRLLIRVSSVGLFSIRLTSHPTRIHPTNACTTAGRRRPTEFPRCSNYIRISVSARPTALHLSCPCSVVMNLPSSGRRG
ncbi:hypothetical protein HMN09_00472900 [Mycena chlorophos]|uniref:Uncharacterized protein n=1 Tax=Mycena chlorophos TaxID=658473 RepID=A0A8H6TIM5_MYCCL|nr:hypothetical protein HMN09_00472900 [Mycena chlorophos]